MDVTEAEGLSRLAPLDGLTEETAHTASLDIGWKRGPVEANLTLFDSDLDDAVRALADNGAIHLVNIDDTTRTRGLEALLRYRRAPFVVTGSYVYVNATELDDARQFRQETPLTPRHTAGFVAMWEDHNRGRLGLEVYYTGKQALEDNPYRSESPFYLEVGLLDEIVFKRFSLFLNAENLLNERVSKHQPMLLPSRGEYGQWTTEAWGSLEGFTLNGGIRIRFGGQRQRSTVIAPSAVRPLAVFRPRFTRSKIRITRSGRF